MSPTARLSRGGRRGAAAFLCAALLAAASPARATGEALTRGASESLAAFAGRVLPPASALAAAPVEVELPPLGRAAVVLFRPQEGPIKSNYTGWVLVPEKGQPRAYRKVALPAMDLIDGLFEVEVKSVFAATVGAGPGRDLCVLYWYYRTGSGDDSGHGTEVYHWTGTAFERRDDAGNAVVGLTTAGKIREKLKGWRPRPAKP